MSVGRINRPGPMPSEKAHLEGLIEEEPDFFRCDGNLICWDCWKPYWKHACDERYEWLRVICNGQRVKL